MVTSLGRSPLHSDLYLLIPLEYHRVCHRYSRIRKRVSGRRSKYDCIGTSAAPFLPAGGERAADDLEEMTALSLLFVDLLPTSLDLRMSGSR